MSDTFTVFMCKTDFEHDVRGATDGARAYPSEKALRAERECVDQCGIVEVRMTLERIVQEEDYSGMVAEMALRSSRPSA